MLCHWDEVPEREVAVGHLHGRWSDLGTAAGSVNVGMRRMRIPAGAQSTPAHVHDAEEETCVVLAGGGLSWQDGATYPVGPGDVILHPAAGPAHTLVAGDDGLEALMFGERRRAEVGRLPRAGVAWIGRGLPRRSRRPELLGYRERRSDDVCGYPHSSKLFMRGLGVVFRVTAVDDWDGEE
jgi:uncharacterized cupin superfamily protein